MEQYKHEYRVISPLDHYPTYSDFFDQEVIMYTYANPLSYYADHFVFNGGRPRFGQQLTLVGWGAHTSWPCLVLVFWSETEQRTYLMSSDGVEPI